MENLIAAIVIQAQYQNVNIKRVRYGSFPLSREEFLELRRDRHFSQALVTA